ncbi:hypothetical protein DFR26_0627 [Paraperlucidibaca baekdonensis]|uniref:DUF8198 domain-containing protein n=1 Tax=Paraperlucidibaca baekdonensis TaxID=748120 RepID=A0A3E0H9P0_9GAMM|nr:hypothetical protein [Paraperlucidibaca baekdonensis]REH40426.1 hypothetical protein DFR26_0627 [Paraperlucidibaca baekdonensis]
MNAVVKLPTQDEPTTNARIRAGLSRYRAWGRHADVSLASAVLVVQALQTARLRRTHASLLADKRYAPITEFFLNDIYTGLELDELAREIEKALPVATRLLPDSVMRTAAIAVEANALTGELDEAVALDLFAHGIDAPSDADLIASYRRLDQYPARHTQMQLLRELGLGLDRYVRSRLITATFKMSKGPAHMAGLAGLYDFMATGFAVMKPMKSVADFLDVFLGREQRILDQLAQGASDPFAIDDESLA